MSQALSTAYNFSWRAILPLVLSTLVFIPIGHSKGGSPEEFKGNLPSVYVVAFTFALTGHYFEGHLTPELWTIALYCLPFFAVGMGVGILLSKKIDAVSFKRIVLSLLGMIGLKLIW